MAGRNKLPDAIKKLKGTDQKCRMTGGNAPVFEKITQIPPAPSYLNSEAKKVYKVTAEQLASIGVLDAVNINTVLMYACEMGKYIEVQKNLKKAQKIDLGYSIKLYQAFSFSIDSKGRPRIERNIWDKLATEYLDNARKLASELGITPASSSKVKIVPKEEKSALEQLADTFK